MATNLTDAISITRSKIYKGACRLVYADPTMYTSFPGRLESIMQPSTPADAEATAYELAHGLYDVESTSEDGVVLRRAAELSDGIPIDQRAFALDEGEPESWDMEAECTLMNTSLEMLQIAWELGTLTAQTADATHVAAHKLSISAPKSFTERMAFLIQEDPKTEKLRCFAFRIAKPQVDSELNLQKTDASGLPLTLKLSADPTITDDDPFGCIFEED